MSFCSNCKKEIPKGRKYCSLECYRSSFELAKRLTNLAQKQAQNRKGKTLEEIYGPEKAKYLRETQYKKVGQALHEKFYGKTQEQIYGKEKSQEIILKSLKTKNATYLDKLPVAQKTKNIVPIIKKSREHIDKINESVKIHDQKVEELYNALKKQKKKCLNVSSRKRDFMPDIILINNGKIIGIELEHLTGTGHDSVFGRARRIKTKEKQHKKVGFFDQINVVFSTKKTPVAKLLQQLQNEEKVSLWRCKNGNR